MAAAVGNARALLLLLSGATCLRLGSTVVVAPWEGAWPACMASVYCCGGVGLVGCCCQRLQQQGAAAAACAWPRAGQMMCGGDDYSVPSNPESSVMTLTFSLV